MTRTFASSRIEQTKQINKQVNKHISRRGKRWIDFKHVGVDDDNSCWDWSCRWNENWLTTGIDDLPQLLRNSIELTLAKTWPHQQSIVISQRHKPGWDVWLLDHPSTYRRIKGPIYSLLSFHWRVKSHLQNNQPFRKDKCFLLGFCWSLIESKRPKLIWSFLVKATLKYFKVASQFLEPKFIKIL